MLVDSSSHSYSFKKKFSELLPIIVAVACVIFYAIAFVKSFQGRWFSPMWTTDDATQQLFPFYRVLLPDAYPNDIIYEVMRGYLAPLHWWIGVVITKFTLDPIMTGHWMMLIQLVLTCGLLGWGVFPHVGLIGSSAVIFWFLHTRPVVQRLTVGLPRGWAAVVFAGFIAFSLRKNFKAMLVFLLIGALLHPPALTLIAIAAGVALLLEWYLHPAERLQTIKKIVLLGIIGAVLIAVLITITKKPDYIGNMVGPKEVVTIPEFKNPGGRFPFYPIPSVQSHIASFVFQPFFTKFYKNFLPGQKTVICSLVVVIFLLCLCECIRRYIGEKRGDIPWVTFVSFFVATIFIYTCSRIWFFKLYVPDRHLQLPFAFLWITFFVVIPPVLFKFNRDQFKKLLYYSVVAVIVYSCSQKGLQGLANFNYPLMRKGGIYEALREKTALQAVLAGEPVSMDPFPLLTQRSAYVTNETYHPFYPKYLEVLRQRFDVSLRATYARTLREFNEATKEGRFDYFIFNKSNYTASQLQKPRVSLPHQETLRQLVSDAQGKFAFQEIPHDAPYVFYVDKNYIVIDMQKFRESFT